MNQVKLGIIGLGNMGSGHCNNILAGLTPEIKLTAAADLRQSRRDWAKETLPDDVVLFENGEQLIESGLCDAVIIATPHYEHPRLAILAFEHGLHVMSEKPAGVYTKQVREMNEAAIRSDKVFGMMFNQRTNCVYRRLKALLDSGELGALKRVTWVVTDWYRSQAYYDSGAWRATWTGEGGGVLLNQCPHQLDLLQWLCGLPVRVRAACHEGKWHDIEVEDDVTAYLEFANGATGTFIASTGDALGENRLEIIGTRARIRIENDQLTLDTLSVDERDWCPVCKEPFGVPEIQHEIVQTDGENPQHAGVLNAFAAHILHGTPLVADGREGIRGLMLSNAMHLSSWTNQTVSLPIDEELFLKLLNEKRRTSRHKDEVDAAIDVSGSFGSTRK